MLHAYVDESGDEGIGDNSSPWLLLGCVVIYEAEVQGAKNFLRNGVNRIYKDRTAPAHVHFNKLKDHGLRKSVIKLLSGLNFTTCVIVARKRDFNADTRAGLRSPRMYNYLARHLLERLSWMARDRDQKITITFSSRHESSWKAFEEYLEILRGDENRRVKFENIHSVGNAPANSDILLQASDWVTSSFAAGLNPDAFEQVETCFAETLWGKYWIRNGNLWSYGIKVLPHPYDRKKDELFRKIDAWLEDPTAIVK